ncbi:polyubiquitin [Anaeramoeba flamelloides]|uniref:Polyubiquitin n=1 Tax=Anaeramoeba flamelloides TaxID=1746091 RepID=A0AAV7YC14_9EUKA|nr:polyubiquitin [Anaeramoeba flamelloides]
MKQRQNKSRKEKSNNQTTKTKKCTICKNKAHFQCNQCKVCYCTNCQGQVHTTIQNNAHKEFISHLYQGLIWINIIFVNGKSISVEIDQKRTVLKLKKQIEERQVAKCDKQILIFKGKELRDEQTLFQSNINQYAQINLRNQDPLQNKFRVKIIKKLTYNPLYYEVHGGHYLEDLKNLVYETEKIPINEQKFILDDQELLEDEKLLDEYNVVFDSRIYLVQKLKLTTKIEIDLHFYNNQERNTTKLAMNLNETAMDLKKKIKNEFGIDIGKQIIIFELHELDNKITFCDYFVKNESPVYLVEKTQGILNKEMELFVKTLTGRTIIIHATPSERVIDLKDKLYKIVAIPQYEQRLIFSGRQLEERVKIFNYIVEQHSTIHLVLRCRGGKPVINLYNYIKMSEYNKEKEFQEKNPKVNISLQLSREMEFSSLFPNPIKRDLKNNLIEWKNVVIEGENEEQKIKIGKREYAYLFWECLQNIDTKNQNNTSHNSLFGSLLKKENSFCVNIQDLPEFLSTQLTIIGLNSIEINDLIVYWVPQIERIKDIEWIQVQFLDENSQYSKIAKLEINPKPSLIKRIFVLFKPLQNQLSNLGQNLDIIPIGKRRGKGLVVVEWGGSIIY